MIRLRIKELLDEKGVKFHYAVLRKLGISDHVIAKYLSGEKKWILLKHAEAICLFLRCEPNDLFEWVPDNKLHDNPHHPLQKIKPKMPLNIDEELKKRTPDELRKLFGKDKEEDKGKKE